MNIGNRNDEFKPDRREPSATLTVMIAMPLLMLAAAGLWYTLHLLQPPPQKVVVMSTGSKTGAYHAFGQRYKELLAKEGVKLELVNSQGSGDNIQRLKDPASDVSAALIQGGIGAGQDNSSLMSIGRMFVEPVWIFHRDGLDLRRLSDLKGRVVSVGPEGSGTRILAIEILKRANVNADNAKLLSVDRDTAVKGLRAGEVDAVVLAFAPEAPALQDLLRDPSIKLLNLREADALVRLMPYLNKVTLPAGVFDLEQNVPAEEVHLVAPVASLVVRDTMHPALVGLLAKAASELHGGPSLVHKMGEFPVPTDPVFPMSDDAERFYKSGQPILQRLLPFWLANFVERMLVLIVPLATVAIPLFKGIPAIYKWRVRRRLDYWYGRLRHLEKAIARLDGRSVTPVHLTEFEIIDGAVQRLNVPKAFAEAYYNLRSHVDLVRGRLEQLATQAA